MSEIVTKSIVAITNVTELDIQNIVLSEKKKKSKLYNDRHSIASL